MHRFGLSDDQWNRIKDCLPGQDCDPGRSGKDNRLFVEAVLYRYRTGIPWADLPARFGDYKNIHKRHKRWAKKKVWEEVFSYLSKDADKEFAMIDSTIIRAHQNSTGAQKKWKTEHWKKLWRLEYKNSHHK